jgi:hypothetical protein
MFKAGEVNYHSKVHRCPTNHGMLKKVSKTWELKFKEYDKSIEIPANGPGSTIRCSRKSSICEPDLKQKIGFWFGESYHFPP